jgi:hypothetical protein
MSLEDIKLVAEVLNGILNPNNEIRKEAEKKLTELRQNTPVLLYSLIVVIKGNTPPLTLEIPDQNIKTIATVLLRKILEIKDHELMNPHWEKMSIEQRQQIKALLLEVLVNEKNNVLRSKIVDAINQVAENVFENEEKWDELILLTLNLIGMELTDDNVPSIECGLNLLAGSFSFVYDDYLPKLEALVTVFRNFYKTNSISLKTRTTRTISEMIAYCDKKETKMLTEFIFNIMETTLQCVNDTKSETHLKYCLKSLTDISSSEPALFVKHFSDLYILMNKVYSKKDFVDENIRELGFEVIVNLVERKPKLFQNDPERLKAFLEELFKYALEMEKEVTEEWATPAQISYFEEDFIYEEKVNSAFSYIDRLVECLDYKFLLPYLSTIILQLLTNENDWRYKYIAFLCVSQVTCYVDDMTMIDTIFDTVFKHTADNNPKVRYTAVNCINEMCESFCPDFEKNYHERIVPIIIERCNDTVLRCQLEAFETLNTFIDKASDEIVALYAQVILDNIFTLFLKDNIPVSLREEILEVVAELASTLQDKFAPYAEKCLKILLENFVTLYTGKQLKSIYGNFIECITIIGPYHTQYYYSIIPDLVKIIVEIQDNIPLSTDPIRNYLREALSRLIPLMKEHFHSLLPGIVNSVIKLVQIVPEMSVSSNPEEQFKIEDLFKSDEPEVRYETNKSVKTSSTEDMQSIIELLNSTIDALQESFLPFVEVAHKEIFGLLKFYVNEEVRQEASNTIPILMKIIAKHVSNRDNVILIAKTYVTELVAAIKKEYDNLTLAIFFDNLGECIDHAGLFLNKDELNQLFAEIMLIFDQVEERRLKLINKQDDLKKNPKKKEEVEDSDDEDNLEEEIEKDIEDIEQIQTAIADVIGFLFKTHKDLCGDFVQKVITEILPKYFRTGASGFEVRMGIFIVDDMIEYLGQDYLNAIWTDLCKAIVTYAENSDCATRQAAVYGIGVFAQHTKDNFAQYAEECLKALGKAFAIHCQDDEESWGAARDNATASLGKIIKHQGKCVDLNLCVGQWIKYLPITYDLGETEEQHGLLCDIITSFPQVVFGSSNEGAPAVFRILGRIYKTKYSNADINTKIDTIMTAVKNDGGLYNILVQTRDSSEDKIRKKLNKFIV